MHSGSYNALKIFFHICKGLSEHVFCNSLLCLSKCDDDTATGSKINMFSCCLHEQITFRKKWLQKQFVKLVRDISWPWILALLLLLLLLLFFLNSAKVFMFITPRDCDDRSLVTQTCLWGLWPPPPSIIENSFSAALLSSSSWFNHSLSISSSRPLFSSHYSNAS